MNLIKNFLTRNDCYKVGRKITPKGVMVHSTGANNPKLSRYVQPNIQNIGINPYNNDWNRPGVNVCVHAFIGKKQDGSIATVQTLPWNYRGWHGGGSSNNTHIGFEICEDGLTDPIYFKAVYQEAVELTAHLCKLYKLDPLKDGVVICHKEGNRRGIASNHMDVEHWFPKHGKSMDSFRNDVKAAMGGSTSSNDSNKEYKVQVKSKTPIFKDTGTFANVGVYTITEEKNGYGKLKSGVGWINLSDAKKV